MRIIGGTVLYIEQVRLALPLALTMLAFAASAQEPGYVGSNVCRTCHPDVWSTFYKNPHYKLIDEHGCESCHGPGAKHVEARGGKATIIAFSQLPPARVLDACLKCHAQTVSRANIRRSPHTHADVVCTGCHSIHKSPVPRNLLARKQTDLCLACHATVKAQFSMPSKHRVLEGFMTCTDCHNPHGSYAPTWRMANRPRLVDQAVPNEEPCMKCHADKRGPFVFEHAAVRVDGCESCHFPHGSMNARLLRRPAVATLCLECHNGAPGFGRTGSGVPLQSASHNMADPKFRNCTGCHVRIHGSNTDERFFR